MLISREREKLLNAISFFVSNTKWCGKVKLFKLLYFLDFEHFKQTGRSVTGMDYYAWPMGPVPVSLYGEMDAPEEDMAESFRFEERPLRDEQHTMLILTPKKGFSEDHFSKRELKIMHALADEYNDAVATAMVEATHLEHQPWHKVFVKEGRRQHLIPYELAVLPDEAELIGEVAKERAQLMKAFH